METFGSVSVIIDHQAIWSHLLYTINHLNEVPSEFYSTCQSVETLYGPAQTISTFA